MSRCLGDDVAGGGDSTQEAVANVQEALELYFDGSPHTIAALPVRSYKSDGLTVRD